MNAQFWSTLGLLLGMAGIVLIFRWGPPQPSFDEGVRRALEEATVFDDGTKVSDIIAEQRERKRRHQFMSRFGLAFIFLGFLSQLIGTWWGV